MSDHAVSQGVVGLYPSIDTKAHVNTHIVDVMLRANDGCDFWERIYNTPDKHERNRLKVKWPVVCTPHGVFTGRKDDAPISWSGLTYHDLDGMFPDAEPGRGHWRTVDAIAALPYVAAGRPEHVRPRRSCAVRPQWNRRRRDSRRSMDERARRAQ